MNRPINSYHVAQIFETLSGEIGLGFPQGSFCTVIRMQGCNLRCAYCDTPQTQQSNIPAGRFMTLEDIFYQVRLRNVLLTGGEPLIQKNIERLLFELVVRGKVVQIETNGSVKPYEVIKDPFLRDSASLSFVVDRKGPSSKMQDRNVSPEQICLFPQSTILKYVVKDDHDLGFAARDIKRVTSAGYKGRVAISPIDGNPENIASIIDYLRFFPEFNLDFTIISLQLHKICSLP